MGVQQAGALSAGRRLSVRRRAPRWARGRRLGQPVARPTVGLVRPALLSGPRVRGVVPGALVLLAGAVLVAGGCTPGPEPTPTVTASSSGPSSSPSASSTGSVTSAPSASSYPSTPPTDPGIPAAARANTIDGAEAFVRYYVQQVNKAARDSDPGLIDILTGPSCPGCKAVRDLIANHRDAGTRVLGDMWQVDQTITQTFDGKTAAVIVTITQRHLNIVDSQGLPVDSIVANHGDRLMTLTYSTHWQVDRLQAV